MIRTQGTSIPSEEIDPESMQRLPDAEVIFLAKSGDKRALNALLKRCECLIYSVLYSLAPDWRPEHEDMCQEVCLRICKNLQSLRNPHAFNSWLRALTQNMVYDLFRKANRLKTVSLDELLAPTDDSAGQDIADFRRQPDKLCEDQEVLESLSAAVESLPQTFREAIVLREYYGLAYDQIGIITRTGVGTVKSRIARARTKMQRQLKSLLAA